MTDLQVLIVGLTAVVVFFLIYLARIAYEPAPTCPGCGRELVEWQEFGEIEQGYRITRRWTGCPAYRDLVAKGPSDGWLEQLRRHKAHWRPGDRVPLKDLT